MQEQQETLSPEQAVEAYRAALQMATYEGTLVWSVFQSFLASNALIIAMIGIIIKQYPGLLVFTKVLPIIGLLLCLFWFATTMREYDYYAYWFAWARYAEGSAFGSRFRMTNDGRKFADGNAVRILEVEQRMRWVSRLFRIQGLVGSAIIAFVIVYIILLWKLLL